MPLCRFRRGPGRFSAGAMAQESRVAVTGKYGSIGPGLDLTYGWSRDIHTRVMLDFAPDEERTGTERIRAAGSLLLDWHPGGGAFRLSRRPRGPAQGDRRIVSDPIRNEQPDELRGPRLGKSSPCGQPVELLARPRCLRQQRCFLQHRSQDPGASTSAARASRDSGNLRVRSTWEPVVATGLSYRF